ncbi:MAG TPA: cell division regulator GpsB [Bacillota bacterium]
MVAKRIQLTGKDILEKEFKTSMRGYHQEEVDEFLDMIIQDYNVFHQQINQLKKENEQLKRMKQQVKKVEEEPKQRATQQLHQPVNYDILKRLSNLEKEVFGKKYAESGSVDNN